MYGWEKSRNAMQHMQSHPLWFELGESLYKKTGDLSMTLFLMNRENIARTGRPR